MNRELTDLDYAALLEFRTGLRRFLRWSEARAREVGLTAAQHQLLLAIRGLAGGRSDTARSPTIQDVVDQLLSRHHSVVELIDRAAAAGLVVREADPDDHRAVRLAVTAEGSQRLAALSQLHREELARLRPQLAPLWEGLEPDTVDAPANPRRHARPAGSDAAAPGVADM